MQFPELLKKAKFKNSKVFFNSHDLDDDVAILDYVAWRLHQGIEGPLTLPHLKKLHRTGNYVKEIHSLFATNGRLDYLARGRQTMSRTSSRTRKTTSRDPKNRPLKNESFPVLTNPKI